MIRLAQPTYLLLGVLLLLPFLISRRRAWNYSSLHLLHGARSANLATWLLASVTTAALLLLLIALARPQWGTLHAEPVQETRDIVLMLDVSLSMDSVIASGIDNTLVQKLALIQRASAEFIQRRQHDRVGILVFGDETFGLWPLSTDKAILQRRLQNLRTILPAELRGTNVIRALDKSLDYLSRHGQARSKVLILLTDGLDTFDSVAQARLIGRLHSSQITLYVLGIDLVENMQMMQFIRQAQAGYFNATKAEELDRIFQEIDRLETSRVMGSRHAEYQDLFPRFALPSLVLLSIALLVKSTWVVDV
jgi:Ca-activated chloride channel family protein